MNEKQGRCGEGIDGTVDKVEPCGSLVMVAAPLLLLCTRAAQVKKLLGSLNIFYEALIFSTNLEVETKATLKIKC